MEINQKNRKYLRRGNTGEFKFQRKDANGHPILTVATKVYFTVKRNTEEVNYLFQKTLDDMTFDGEGYYHLTIDPEDTANLEYGDYVYDVEVIVEDYKNTPVVGILTICDVVTFPQNED